MLLFDIFAYSLMQNESQGPLLTVSGGFFDGKSTVIEPLTEPCLMLPDYSMKRQEQLANVLFAMKEAVESLSRPMFVAF